MCLALLLERIWKHFVELSNNSIYSSFCRLKRLTMILHPKRLPNHCKSLHAKESENILKHYSIVDRWSSGHYHDQNYVTMTKMNVPWIFFKKNPKNILKNCPALEFQQSTKTFQRTWAWRRWTCLGLLLKSRKDFEELSSSRVREITMSKITWNDKVKCALAYCLKESENILKNCPIIQRWISRSHLKIT